MLGDFTYGRVQVKKLTNFAEISTLRACHALAEGI